jgi:hypothetical protein
VRRSALTRRVMSQKEAKCWMMLPLSSCTGLTNCAAQTSRPDLA